MEYRLDELFDLQMGKTPSRKNLLYWNTNDYKWISIADLTKGDKYILNTKEYISEKAVRESGINVIPPNTVVMSFKLSIGKTAITVEPMYSNEAIISFIDKHIVKMSAEYLYYLFSGKNWDSEANKAAKGKTLNKTTLSASKVKIHTLSEQEKIVDRLNIVKRIIELRKQQIVKLDNLIKARFVEIFGTFPANEKGWETGTIRDVVKNVRYGSSRKASIGSSGKYPYLRMNNITYKGDLDLSDIKTIDIPDSELLKCSVRKGDVLFNRTNSKELVGKTCVYNRTELMVLAGFIIRVRVNEKMLPEILSEFLNTSFSKQMLMSMCKAAIGQANINSQEMQNIAIYIPPIEKQKEYVAFKEQVDSSKVVVQKALYNAQLLFDSLMQEYFG